MFLFFLVLLLFTSCSSQDIADVDFDVSLGASRMGKRFFCKKEFDRASYEKCHLLWNNNRPKRAAKREKTSIPKAIHQLWLSRSPLPEEYKRYQETWIRLHPDWKYHLWTDRDIKTLPADLQARLKAAKDIQEQEDLLKAAILLKLGGVVVDVAFTCLKPLDAFHDRYDFYTSLEPPLEKPRLGGILHASPLIIGATPHHPLVSRWQELMLQKYRASPEEHLARERSLLCACMSFDESVRTLDTNSKLVNVILPPTYFFPLNHKALQNMTKKKKKSSLFSSLFEEKPLFSTIAAESYAVHHDGGFWARAVTKKKRVKKLQQILSLN